MDRPPLMTVAELKAHLTGYHDDDKLEFSGLDFYRFKRRGTGFVQIEFNQTVYRPENGEVVIENHLTDEATHSSD